MDLVKIASRTPYSLKAEFSKPRGLRERFAESTFQGQRTEQGAQIPGRGQLAGQPEVTTSL